MIDGRTDPISKLFESRMAMLELTAELNKIYAKDDSEKAHIAAINAIKATFGATAAALFYVNDKNVFRMCFSGTDFPIGLPEARWRACVIAHGDSRGTARFGPWSLPGLEEPIPSWISAWLYGKGGEGAFVFLGREGDPWSDQDLSSLETLKEAISPIVETRHERMVEEQKRSEAERRLARSERRLRNFFEGSRDMLYTARADDVIVSVNDSAAKLLSYSSKAEMTGKPFRAFMVNPEDRRLFFQKMTAQGYVDDYETLLLRKDGVAIFCIETAHALKDAAGEIIEIQGLVKDISARVADEQKLWKMNLELASANLQLQKTQMLMMQQEKLASIGQLAAGVAHEINNPLGFLTSNQKTLERYFLKIKHYCIEKADCRDKADADPERGASIQGIFKDAEAIFLESSDGFERIVKIVSNLKNFSRVDRVEGFSEYDLNAGVESTLVVAWNEIKYVAELRKSYGEIPHIYANGGEINQVVLNVVVNAAQAIGRDPKRAPGEKGEIEVSTRSDVDRVVLVIRDDGPGIPESIKSKIFDPFFTTKEPGKGTGLGLNIAYDIVVNRHKGQIWADSEQGVGTSFYISLPVGESAAHGV